MTPEQLSLETLKMQHGIQVAKAAIADIEVHLCETEQQRQRLLDHREAQEQRILQLEKALQDLGR